MSKKIETARQRFESVWDAIEDTPAQADNMRLRSELMMEISSYIKSEDMTQAEAAERFGVTQPRISDLVRGKINLFSLDSLVTMWSAAGKHVHLQVTDHELEAA